MKRISLFFVILGLILTSCARPSEKSTPAVYTNVRTLFNQAPSIQKAYFAGGCFWGVEAYFEKIEGVEVEKAQVVEVLETYYESDRLKAEYSERTDTDLINHFKNGVLSRYKSDDIALRTTELLTILDNIRKDVVWEQ